MEFYRHRCECGCNEQIVVRKSHKYDGVPKYIKDHNFRKGYWEGKKRTKEQRINIAVGTRIAMNTLEIKNKLRKPKTEEHKEKLKIASMGNQSAKGSIRTEGFKENCKNLMKGNKRGIGKRSESTKRNNSNAAKRNWQNLEYRKKRLTALHKHHIYLDGDDEKILMLSSSKHLQLHSKAYEYLVEINKIEHYIKWFDKKYNLFRKE
tara:strand:- start:24323 stop:24940 length:618 start_codon:yes stop_codon:yes gene_type:complete